MLMRINICIDQHRSKTKRILPWEYVELVVIYETERLNAAALEYSRDVLDCNDIGLILIGTPFTGSACSASRIPQLYSSTVGSASATAPDHCSGTNYPLCSHGIGESLVYSLTGQTSPTLKP